MNDYRNWNMNLVGGKIPEKHKKIKLIIKNSRLANDDMLLTYSEIDKNNDKRYSDIINFSLKNLFKNNQEDINKNIIEFNQILENRSFDLKMFYLNKTSPKFKKLKDEGKAIRNACIVLTLDEPINSYNTISLFVDIEKDKANPADDEIYFYLKRLEFLQIDQQLNSKNINDLKLEIKLDKEFTSMFEIKNLITSTQSFHDGKDYDNNQDKLLLQKWANFLKILKKIYCDSKSKNEKLNNCIICFNKKVFICSDSKFSHDNKNLVLVENEYPLFKMTKMKFYLN